jgi:hypothetical protein
MRTATLMWTVWMMTLTGAPLCAQDPAPNGNPTGQTPWIQQLDPDQLDPKQEDDVGKILLMLRNEDIPRTKRIEYARRYLRGEYRFHIADFRDKGHELQARYSQVLLGALRALGRMNDVESIPLLEEKLKQWSAELEKPYYEQTTAMPSVEATQVVLARLKAVRDIPEVKTADDLIRRLERMLHYIGFDGSVEQWVRALEQEMDRTKKISHPGYGTHEMVLQQYEQMLVEAGWRGVDVEPAARIIRINPNELLYKITREQFEQSVQLAKIPRHQVAQWIVEQAPSWKAFTGKEELFCRVLVDMGSSVLPLVWSKVEWGLHHQDKVKGMGMVALMEVLATLAGKDALPLIEPFTQDKDEWVRYFACQVKEDIEKGRVFRNGILLPL